MTATLQRSNQPKLYQHENDRYVTLNSLNKTLARFVQGQKYTVGTGLILVQIEENRFEKIKVSSKTTYKKFLRQVLSTEISTYDLVAFQWIPVRVVREDTLAILKCIPDECDPPGCPCKMPGCFCQPNSRCG